MSSFEPSRWRHTHRLPTGSASVCAEQTSLSSDTDPNRLTRTAHAHGTAQPPPDSRDSEGRCAVLDTVTRALAIVSELGAVTANEEKIATLNGTLTMLRSQLAAMIELRACPAAHAPPPNTASAPTGAEGGPPCSCGPTGVLHSRQGRVCAVRNDRCCEGGRGCGQ